MKFDLDAVVYDWIPYGASPHPVEGESLSNLVDLQRSSGHRAVERMVMRKIKKEAII